MKSIIVPATLDSLDKAIEFILAGAKALGLDEQKLTQIRLAAEEIIVNIINYAYPHRKDGKIEIKCLPKDGSLSIEVADEGVPFNPLSLPEPDTKASLEERKIGGLGIFLVRKVMDEVSYRRQDDKNVFIMVKKL